MDTIQKFNKVEGLNETRETQVYKELNDTKQLVSILDEVIKTLFSRLKPVINLQTRTPLNTETPKDDVVLVPLASEIKEINNRLKEREGALTYLISLIEV